MRQKNNEIVFLFKSLARIKHGIHIVEVLGMPVSYVTDTMDYYSKYLSKNFSEKYGNKKIKNLKNQTILFLCADYPEEVKEHYQNSARFFPLSCCQVFNIRRSNGDFIIKLKIGSLIRLKSINLQNYTQQIRDTLGDENLPLWYKCGPNLDQNQFSIATIGIKNHLKLYNEKKNKDLWEKKVREIHENIDNSKNFIFYFIEKIGEENTDVELLGYSGNNKSEKELKLKKNTQYSIQIYTFLHPNNKWKNSASTKPYIYIEEAKDLIIPLITRKNIPIDSTRPNLINLKFRTGEKLGNCDIKICFGPDTDIELQETKAIFPCSIVDKKKFFYLFMFIVFLSFHLIGNVYLNLAGQISFECKVLINVFIGIGTIGALSLLYRRRIY